MENLSVSREELERMVELNHILMGIVVDFVLSANRIQVKPWDSPVTLAINNHESEYVVYFEAGEEIGTKAPVVTVRLSRYDEVKH
jgi:hypothetical protein